MSFIRFARAGLLRGAPLLTLFLAAASMGAGARAQDAFIQIEAKRSLAEGRQAAQEHEARLGEVSGFVADGGWHVVALGPFRADEARARLARLAAERRVPGDAFLTDGERYRRRFWPQGALAQTAAETAPPAAAARPQAPTDETVAEARASEAALGRGERERVQEALAGAGVYDGPIDAAFGGGTRGAMAAWQSARGQEATGVLTTAQRATLLGEFDAVFDGLGMAVVEDAPAGIRVEMPAALLSLEGRETPFARYAASGGGEARLVLISQAGDRRTLAGLFEVLQSLDIVPPEGEREIEGDRFRLSGADGRVVTQGFAGVEDGRIKGMLLVRPQGDEDRRARLWARMRQSFDGSSPAALGEAQATPAAAQDVDRLAGLAIRQPALERSGFYVDGGGSVLTSGEVAGDACGTILIDDEHAARVAWSDGRVALLAPEGRLAPMQVAAIALEPARLGSSVAVAGFPFGAALDRASLTFGRLEDLRGLTGDEAFDRYALAPEAGDAGGPVLAQDGSVTGLLLPADGGEAGGRALPDGVAIGVETAHLAASLREAGIEPIAPTPAGPLTPERLTREAVEMTVLVACYD